MRQRTLGIIGAALVGAGLAINVGSDIAAQHFAPAAALAPARGHFQMPHRNRDGGQIGNFPGRQPGFRPGPPDASGPPSP